MPVRKWRIRINMTAQDGQERIMSQANDLPAGSAPAAATPRQNEFNLVWVDMEMTGLEPDTDRIIEVAVIVTDMHLNVLAEAPVFVIHQSDETLDKMDNW